MHVAVFSFLHTGRYTYVYMLRVRLYYDTCPSLHGHGSSLQPANRPTVCTYTFATRMTMTHMLRPVGSRLSGLPCVRRCRWLVPAVRGGHFFHEIRWPVRWVPAVMWRNNYFARNKEALPCYGRGPSYQPLHVQSTSDGSRSLTTLTTPRREHQGGGRWRGLGRGRRGAGEDAAVDVHA